MNLKNTIIDKPNISQGSISLVEILRQRAQNQPDRQAYIFLQNGETESGSLTYGELDRQARAIASHLQSWQGERALLLYPSGLEFITAFFGCLYAGVVAVPVYPPRRNQKLSRLLSIANDAQAKLALTTTSILADIEKRWQEEGELAQLKLVATDTIEANPQEYVPQSVTPDSLAFLQYTSGSTGNPKGVMVTHGNILHNQQLIYQAFGHSEQSIVVGWLPLFHDMGLIGNVLQPMYLGIRCILMPPGAFLEKPIRWLQMISKYRATTSGGPNFAYDLCVKKVSQEQLANLDLSSWDVAFSGSQPVRAETLEQFSQKFSQCGFNYKAFYPCYGMAETTLFTTGGDKNQKPVIRRVSAGQLKKNSVVETEISSPESQFFVGCGHPHMDTRVTIVNPDSLTRCEEGQVGEIWVSGGSIASGYWNRPSATKETFQAYLQDMGEGSFLRTGDLGFFSNGNLFVTGRMKDVIIIRGSNHYPQDIELTVQKSHRALQEHCGAAFSVEVEGQEQLVVMQEVKRTYLRELNVDEVFEVIRREVSKAHGLQAYAVMLIKTGSIPKTSSGKIQRHACREAFLSKNLSTIGSSILDQSKINNTNQRLTIETSQQKEQSSLIFELCKEISQCLGISNSPIKPHQLISNLGLDSLQALEIKNYLEVNFGLVVPIENFFEDITVARLASDILNLRKSPTVSEAQFSSQQDKQQLKEVLISGAEIKSESNGKATENIDLDSRLRLVYKPTKNVLQRAREFELPDQLRATGLLPYFRELERNEGATCLFDGRQVIMLGSNNYLGLTADQRVREATALAALEDGPSLTGSRLLNGSTYKHREFERKLATFLGHEDALVFTTGYQANLGFISALMNEETTIVLDSEAHACVYDGAFMSRCKVVQYQHNDLDDLEKKLQKVANQSATMVVIDGVYSMTGDIAPLAEIRVLCDRYNVTLAVDDAHGLGVLGASGKGTEEHFNMVGSSDILCGTFSKSLASIGGWVASEAKVIDWIRFNGRSMLFSASIPPTSLAAASTALDILIAEPWRVQNLNDNGRYWQQGLKQIGFDVSESQTPIVPVIIGDDMKCMVFGKELLEAGVYVNSVVYPAVPRTKALLRTSVMATHSKNHLDRALEIFAIVGKKLELID